MVFNVLLDIAKLPVNATLDIAKTIGNAANLGDSGASNCPNCNHHKSLETLPGIHTVLGHRKCRCFDRRNFDTEPGNPTRDINGKCSCAYRNYS